MAHRAWFVAGVGASLVARMCGAAWTVVSLHPAGATSSEALGVFNGVQVGQVNNAGGAWSGTAESFVPLTPATAQAFGISGSQIVGRAFVSGQLHAELWNSVAGAPVDLQPAGVLTSEALSVEGGYQAGYIRFSTGFTRACWWSGSAASMVDLNPAGSPASECYAVQGSRQVGWAATGTTNSAAAMWTGTAASYVNLHPAGWTNSAAYALYGDAQGGRVMPAGGQPRAALWHGTAASFVDLTPAGATVSHLYGMAENAQVGMAAIGGNAHAGVWNGTAASWRDLHVLLPAGYSFSTAKAVWRGGGALYVVGSATRASTGQSEAFMWVERTCGSADFNADGDTATDADIEAFFACLAGNCCAACGSADFDADGDVATDADIEAFFRVLAGGTC